MGLFDSIGDKAVRDAFQGISEQQTAIFEKLNALESKAAQDVKDTANIILDGMKPAIDAVNTLTLTANAAVTEILRTIRRVDGMKLESTITLGPDEPDAAAPGSMEVKG